MFVGWSVSWGMPCGTRSAGDGPASERPCGSGWGDLGLSRGKGGKDAASRITQRTQEELTL